MRVVAGTSLVVAALVLGGCFEDAQAPDPQPPPTPPAQTGCSTVACVLQDAQRRTEALAIRAQDTTASAKQQTTMQQQATAAASAQASVLNQQPAPVNDNAAMAQWYADRAAYAQSMVEMERGFAEQRAAVDARAGEQRERDRLEARRLEQQRQQLALDNEAQLRRAAEEARQRADYVGTYAARQEESATKSAAIWGGAY